MFKIGNIQIENNICLAPLAGYTNEAYLRIMKETKVGLMYTEMVSARGLLYDNDKTWDLTKCHKDTHPVSLQIFGGDIEDMKKAAILIDTKTDADIIDINMGCPIKKVLRSGSGSKLLDEPLKIYEMVKAVVESVKKPVTVKIRAGGTHDNINCVEVARLIEKAGAKAIAIHGRCRSDLYRGTVNLDYIKMVKESVSIPVIGNGDIKTIEDAKKMFEYTKCDAIMIGRGSLGNPWFVRDVVNYFSSKEKVPSPSKEEKIAMCQKHFEYLLEIKPEKLAVLEMRSLASWYMKGIIKSQDFKENLVKIKTKEDFYNLFSKL